MMKNTSINNDSPAREFKFYLGSRQRYITIGCNFDSGNINLVRQISEFTYRLQSIHDGTRTGNKVNSKSWFYFSVKGFPKITKGKFIISQVQTLQSIYHSKYNKSYRPVFRSDRQEWKRLQTQAILSINDNGELQCLFEYIFRSENEQVEFAFCYPYSYAENLQFLSTLNEYFDNNQFYFYKQILISSVQKRLIHLLTITSHDHINKENEYEDMFNQKLFCENNRPKRYNKPVILISARVHPGETPASYAMEGVIKFLCNVNDLRACLLRKMFVFMIVPMINVDGVYYGHFRMDSSGKNLNRFYKDPNPEKQPAIYAIKQLAKYLNKNNRLSFYFDLHAHNAKKGSFIYGNAINDFVEQVQSQVFCKLFALNHRGFQYQYCNFSQKHMKAKDCNEDLTKQGCGRVVMYKLANIIHSYSLECGIISANSINQIPDACNQQFTLGNKKFLTDESQEAIDIKNVDYYSTLFTQDTYRNLGKNLLVTVLDVFDKNPYNRIYNSTYKSMDMLRRMTAFQIFHHTQRFRMFQKFVFGKVKNINELIRQVLNMKLHYKKLYNFYFYDDKELKDVEWPSNVIGLLKPIKKSESPTKMRRLKMSVEPKQKYTQSFVNALQQSKEQNSKICEKNGYKMQNKSKQIAVQSSQKSSQTEDYQPEEIKLEEKQFEKLLQFEEEDQMNSKIDLLEGQIKFSHQQSAVSMSERKELLDSECIQQSNSVYGSLSFVSKENLHQIEKDNPIIAVGKNNIYKSKYEKLIFQSPTKSIYAKIKEDIKSELKKQDKKRIAALSKLPAQYEGKTKLNYLSHMGQMSQIKRKVERDLRIKSTTTKKLSNRADVEVQLPSISSKVYVITTSSKTINKKF